MSDSLQPNGPWPTRLLCSWDSPGKNAGSGYHFLLQGIFLSPGIKAPSTGPPALQADCSPLRHWRSPLISLKICTFPVSGVNMKTQIASHQFRSDSIAKNVWFVEGFGAGNTELKKKNATHTNSAFSTIDILVLGSSVYSLQNHGHHDLDKDKNNKKVVN